MRHRVENLMKDVEKMVGEDGVWKVPQCEYELRISEWVKDDVLSDFRTYRDHIHVREHAMLALIPLMQHLSCIDSKKLIYAVFVQQHGPGGLFSNEHFGKYTFKHNDLPCGQGQDFGAVFKDALCWIKGYGWRPAEHEILLRLFGLPLPRNIVAAMADFLVERLYQHDHPFDVDSFKCSNALAVLPYLERSVYENPDNGPLVWECLERAIQNAIHAVQGFGVEDIGHKEREIYTKVIVELVGACISTRALRAAPAIRNIYEEPQVAILTVDPMPLNTLLRIIHDSTGFILDTPVMYSDR